MLSYQQPNNPFSFNYLSLCLLRLHVEFRAGFQELLVVIFAKVQTFQHDPAVKADIVSQNALLLFEVNIADKNLMDGLL